ncbi:hypothetical protein Tco_0532383 [Tanacetum coccineum]
MREFREDTFSGNKNDDAHEHVERILDIIGLFNIPRVTHDAVMLRVFPITLISEEMGRQISYRDNQHLGVAQESFHLKHGKDLQGSIPNKTPAQALDAIQTMADHSKKWHHGSTSRKVSNGSLVGIATIISKLDSFRIDMKKLKENVHAIQVGCETCEGTHLNKECPLHEDIKSVEEVKYGDFGRPFPNNNGKDARYRIGPPRYYTSSE